MTPLNNSVANLRRAKFVGPTAYNLAAAISFLTIALATPARAGEAKGTLSYKGKTVSLNFAYLVKGPDAVETKTIIRRVILSATDLSAKIQSCKSMNCSDADLSDGLAVDFDIGPRLVYRLAMNNGLVQYSFGAKPDAWKEAVSTSTRLKGKLSFDHGSAGGPIVEVEFDAPLVTEFKLAR